MRKYSMIYLILINFLIFGCATNQAIIQKKKPLEFEVTCSNFPGIPFFLGQIVIDSSIKNCGDLFIKQIQEPR